MGRFVLSMGSQTQAYTLKDTNKILLLLFSRFNLINPPQYEAEWLSRGM